MLIRALREMHKAQAQGRLCGRLAYCIFRKGLYTTFWVCAALDTIVHCTTIKRNWPQLFGCSALTYHRMRYLQHCYLERNVLPKSYGFHTDSLSSLRTHQVARFQLEVKQLSSINSGMIGNLVFSITSRNQPSQPRYERQYHLNGNFVGQSSFPSSLALNLERYPSRHSH